MLTRKGFLHAVKCLMQEISLAGQSPAEHASHRDPVCGFLISEIKKARHLFSAGQAGRQRLSLEL